MIRYIFLASSAYSGSTLLSVLLGEHPEIATTSDVSGKRRTARMEEFRCSCGRLMRDCPFWADVRARMEAAGVGPVDLADFRTGFDLGSGLSRRLRTGSLRWNALEHLRDDAVEALWPGHAAAMEGVATRTAALAEAVASLQGASVFVDASKERLRIRHLARRSPHHVGAIHLVRDPRGVVNSALRRHAGSGETLEHAARNWSITNRTIMRALGELPRRSWMAVSYEELCSDVAGTMARLYAFCGVDPGFVPTGSGEGQHLLGNQMRLGPIGEIRLDERWRTGLTPDQQAKVLRLTARTQARLEKRHDRPPG